MRECVTVTVSGPVGSGKSAVLGEIEIALKAVGVSVRYDNEADARSEKNMTGADWHYFLDMYQPDVVLVEHIDHGLPVTPGPWWTWLSRRFCPTRTPKRGVK